LLNEERFYQRRNYLRFSDELFFDLYNDYYCNLNNFELKYPIFYDADAGEAEHEYKKMTNDYDFKGFINEYFYEYFDEISAQIRFFYNKNLFHIDLSDAFQSKIIRPESISFKVPELIFKEKEKETGFANQE